MSTNLTCFFSVKIGFFVTTPSSLVSSQENLAQAAEESDHQRQIAQNSALRAFNSARYKNTLYFTNPTLEQQ
ncbi:MAG: hypothetical protein AB7U63_11875 [Porticoccaceae bacterium]|jgi:hypothetical protein